jgi:Dolichyl-phosphate-mannose-protein mannosyltransferase
MNHFRFGVLPGTASAHHDTNSMYMSRFFTRERFGSAQFVAAAVLLAFLLQCLWFCSRVPLSDHELAFVLQGQRAWVHGDTAFHLQASPVTGLLAALPLLGSHPSEEVVPGYWRWLARLPFMIVGVLFGGSIWYVARRLYGNIAGYIALALYSFSPWFVIHSAVVQPEIIAGWGAFGIVFTAIGVSHSLYAPHEVILWNWKRILLLGVAIGIGCSAHSAVMLLVPVSLGFMWYLVPERRSAATVILAAACVLGAVIFLFTYGFHLATIGTALASSHLTQFNLQSYAATVTWAWLATFFIRQQATVTLLLAISLVTFAAWKRARFFGTTAPLLVFAILLLVGTGSSAQGALPFYLMALPFAFVFIAGVLTDLLESRHAPLSLGLVLGVLIGHIVIGISGLLRM